MSLNPAPRFKRQDAILRQEVSGAVVLFNMEDGRYYALDELGARIWDLCDGVRNVAELAAILHDEYDAPVDTIHQDVEELLRELSDERLVVQADQTT